MDVSYSMRMTRCLAGAAEGWKRDGGCGRGGVNSVFPTKGDELLPEIPTVVERFGCRHEPVYPYRISIQWKDWHVNRGFDYRNRKSV
jgi:hypothetical protein